MTITSKSVTRWVIVALLLTLGAYNLEFAVKLGHWAYWMWAGVTFVSAIGLGMMQPWSRYPIYILSLATVLYWLYVVWSVWKSGWPYDDAVKTAISLAPGILLVVVCMGTSWFVFSLFKDRTKIT